MLRFSAVLSVAVLAVSATLGSVGAQTSSPCFQDAGVKSLFGSDEQVEAMQQLAASDCKVIGLSFKALSPARSTLLVADLENGEMLRLKVDAMSRPWERWFGFTRQDLLDDEPSDGFDLKGFTASISGQTPSVSPPLEAFIKKNRMQAFLP